MMRNSRRRDHVVRQNHDALRGMYAPYVSVGVDEGNVYAGFDVVNEGGSVDVNEEEINFLFKLYLFKYNY